MSELNLEGMAIAPGVVETIVSLAVREVEGVVSVGPAGGLRLFGNRQGGQGIEVTADEKDELHVDVHVDVRYGISLPKVAEDIRTSVADAVTSQVGLKVAAVDVYVEAVQFE